MNDIAVLYAYHIDELRRSSKIKVSDFCDGICSDRQYRRYISGAQIITQKNINLFCDKLELSTSDFFNSFYIHDKKEYQRVFILYNSINNGNLESARNIIDDFVNYKFLNIQNNRWFDYCKIKVNHLSGKITIYNALDDYKVLVDYPKCIEKKIFDFVDILIIMNIAYIENELGTKKALFFLYKTLIENKIVYVSSDSRHIMPAIYAGIARILASHDEVVECEKISSKGINYCLKINDIHVLPHLYFFKAASLKKLGNINKAMIEAKKCLACVITKDNKREIEIFYDLIWKELRIKPYDLFLPNFIKIDNK